MNGTIKRLAFNEVTGFDSEGNEIGRVHTRVKDSNGVWVTPERARMRLKTAGAVKFKRQSIWTFEPYIG